MAGVSSVKVAPEYRGLGIGRLLMTALLDEIAARGYPLSALFPATMPLYRSLGWELAGARDTVIIPARSLRGLVPPDAAVSSTDAGPDPVLRRAGSGDAGAVIAVLGRVHEAARDCGPITRDTATVAEWLSGPDLYAYLAEDGFLAYQWHHGNRDLYVERAEAVSGQTVRAFWAHLGSYASVAEKVYARTGPASALWWLTRERDADIAHRSRWMLRVVDAPAAVAARGFPDAVSVRVPPRIADGPHPANAGRWQLAVAGGAGTLGPLAPAADEGAALAVGPRGLAALYAGTPVMTLRQASLAAGGTADGDPTHLPFPLHGTPAFAATAYMLDAF
jgi:predicted acetyltransferase